MVFILYFLIQLKYITSAQTVPFKVPPKNFILHVIRSKNIDRNVANNLRNFARMTLFASRFRFECILQLYLDFELVRNQRKISQKQLT